MDNKTNFDVVNVHIVNSDIPFVITEFFRTFPYLELFMVESGGLRRIQSHAVQHAPRLSNFYVAHNPNLTTIHPLAFSGGFFLREVHFPFNSVSEIHPNAFVGLNNVWNLNFNVNKIKTLPKNVFRPLTRLTTISFGTNLIETLDGDLFTHNQRLHQIGYSFNNIYAIDRHFLKRTPFVNLMGFQRNECIDTSIIVGFHSNETIQERFQLCFDNYDEMKQQEVN
jgi:hypothetical protein